MAPRPIITPKTNSHRPAIEYNNVSLPSEFSYPTKTSPEYSSASEIQKDLKPNIMKVSETLKEEKNKF